IKLYFVLAILFFIYFLIILLGNWVVRRYISKEYTLSTKILSHISKTSSEFEVIKSNTLEDKSLDKLQKLVIMDTYFRLRRNIWLSLSPKIIFAGVIILIVLSYFFNLFIFPNVIFGFKEYVNFSIFSI